jgi:hypothetical protein
MAPVQGEQALEQEILARGEVMRSWRKNQALLKPVSA